MDESQENNEEINVQKPKSRWLMPVICLVVGIALGFGSATVLDKEDPIPMPSEYASYDDCANNGGLLLTAEFNACVSDHTVNNTPLWLQYSAQNLPRLNERKTTQKENVVSSDVNIPADLQGFLLHDDTGCETGYYRVTKLVENRFSQMHYGCDEDEAAKSGAYQIIAINLADGWSFISPTNHMNEQGLPSCLLVDMFRVSSKLSDSCFENTGYNNGLIRPVEHP